jgi:hypothetical protein
MNRRLVALSSFLVVGGSLVALACSGSSASDPAPPTAEPPEERPLWDEPSFELRSELAGPYTAGTEGHFAIRLTPRGNYHVNQDYPLSITLTAPSGVTFPHPTVDRAQATTMTEQLAAFDVPFTSAAGAQHVRALVDFAVCTPERCMPDTRTLAIDLSVQ